MRVCLGIDPGRGGAADRAEPDPGYLVNDPQISDLVTDSGELI
jgi:hypothetical protein